MRVVAVNHLHPLAPHVGATRVARFADALAARGHQVVLLTASLDASGPGGEPDPDRVALDLAQHDWARPFHIACCPQPMRSLALVRAGRLARPLRQAVLAWHYLRHGGVFTDWRFATRPYGMLLARAFHPDIAWATFGNTDAWMIAQEIARYSGCPWVMDLKDVWDAFVPRPIAWLILRRFRDAAACTGLSRAHLNGPGRRLGLSGSVVYSGIPARLLPPHAAELPFRITITGSTYGWLAPMVEGVGQFVDQLPAAERAGVVFTYAGGEHGPARDAAQRIAGRCGIDIRPFVPLDELAGLQRQAFLNIYGRATRRPDFFHHKLFELLCADRPIACYPGEAPEAAEIAAGVGGNLYQCADAAGLAHVLSAAWRARQADGIGIDRQGMSAFTWDAQAAKLEAVFEAARIRR